MTQNIGSIENLIRKKSPSRSPKPKPPSRIELLEDRVATLESTLNKVLSELTALRADVEGLKTLTATPPKETPPKENTAKHTEPSAKVDAKPTPTETQTQPPPPKTSKRTRSGPWDDPEIRKELEAVRPRILELLSDGQQITKQGCADALNIAATLAGRTLSYMMTQTKEIEMISPPKTPADPDPKKLFRLKT